MITQEIIDAIHEASFGKKPDLISDLSDLKKLLKLCRSMGVVEIDIGSAKIKLGPMPPSKSKEEDPEPELTEEELMFYSSGKHT
jgi:hypothetical protein